MDGSTMEDIVRAAGWTPIQRIRRKNRTYLYASKRQGGKIVERYLGAISKLQEMSTEQFRTLLIDKTSR